MSMSCIVSFIRVSVYKRFKLVDIYSVEHIFKIIGSYGYT